MLQGVRIVEVSALGAAPFASMMLADLGADVIVVHRKESGSVAGMPERSVLDRGKRSIALNLKEPDDAEVFKRLVSRSNALVEGFRPGVMERLGLGPDVCLALNRSLIYGRLTGWGQTGYMSQRAGHDLNYVGMSGAAWFSSMPGHSPFPPPTLVGDVGGGALYLVAGILSGIISARQSGQGTVVDAAMIDGSAHMMNLLMSLRQTGALSMKRGASLLDGPHWCRCYRTADDQYMSVQCLEPKFYAEFLQALNLQDEADFQEQHNAATWTNLAGRLELIFSQCTQSEWETVFMGTDACVAPVLHPEQMLTHRFNRERQTWMDVNGVLQARAAPRFSDNVERTSYLIPAHDEHRQEILDEIRD